MKIRKVFEDTNDYELCEEISYETYESHIWVGEYGDKLISLKNNIIPIIKEQEKEIFDYYYGVGGMQHNSRSKTDFYSFHGYEVDGLHIIVEAIEDYYFLVTINTEEFEMYFKCDGVDGLKMLSKKFIEKYKDINNED